MCLFQYEDDPEPEERGPAGPLYVPARPGTAQVVVRLFRTPLGARTAVGFAGGLRFGVHAVAPNKSAGTEPAPSGARTVSVRRAGRDSG